MLSRLSFAGKASLHSLVPLHSLAPFVVGMSTHTYVLPAAVQQRCEDKYFEHVRKGYKLGSNFHHGNMPLKDEFLKLSHQFLAEQLKDDPTLLAQYAAAKAAHEPFEISGILKGDNSFSTASNISPESLGVGFFLAMMMGCAKIMGYRLWQDPNKHYTSVFLVHPNRHKGSTEMLPPHTDFGTCGERRPKVNALGCVQDKTNTPTFYIKSTVLWEQLTQKEQQILSESKFIIRERNLPYNKENEFHIFSKDGTRICFDGDTTGLECVDYAGYDRKEVTEAVSRLCKIVFDTYEAGKISNHFNIAGNVIYYPNDHGLHGRMDLPYFINVPGESRRKVAGNDSRVLWRTSLSEVPTALTSAQQKGEVQKQGESVVK